VSETHPAGWSLDEFLNHLDAEHGWKEGDESKDIVKGFMTRQGDTPKERKYFQDIVDSRHKPEWWKAAEGGVVRKVYAVVENMPGYLPESDPVWFASKEGAEAYAKEREDELEPDSPYVVDIIEETSDKSVDELNEQGYGFAHGGIFPHRMQEGAIVEEPPAGVPAVIGEAGPEAVIPLDDPAAVETMAEAIEEGGGGTNANDATVAAAEAVESAAEAVEVVAASDAVEAVAESHEAEAEAVEEVVEAAVDAATETKETEADVTKEVVKEAPDRAPEAVHGFFR